MHRLQLSRLSGRAYLMLALKALVVRCAESMTRKVGRPKRPGPEYLIQSASAGIHSQLCLHLSQGKKNDFRSTPMTTALCPKVHVPDQFLYSKKLPCGNRSGRNAAQN